MARDRRGQLYHRHHNLHRRRSDDPRRRIVASSAHSRRPVSTGSGGETTKKNLGREHYQRIGKIGVQRILHAGGLSSLSVLDQLTAYAPVDAVQGNVERPEVVTELPIPRELVVDGCVIGMVHDLGERRWYARNARNSFPTARVVFGHSHTPLVEDADGLLLLKLGSATDRRRQSHGSVALLTIQDGQPGARLIELPSRACPVARSPAPR